MDCGLELKDLPFLRSQFRSLRNSNSFIPTMESNSYLCVIVNTVRRSFTLNSIGVKCLRSVSHIINSSCRIICPKSTAGHNKYLSLSFERIVGIGTSDLLIGWDSLASLRVFRFVFRRFLRTYSTYSYLR